jgi:hypothetical protein
LASTRILVVEVICAQTAEPGSCAATVLLML